MSELRHKAQKVYIGGLYSLFRFFGGKHCMQNIVSEESLLKRIAASLKRVMGIKLPESQYKNTVNFVNERCNALKINRLEYLELLDNSSTEQSLLIDTVTINETYFFREAVQFAALEKYLLPSLIQRTFEKKSRLNVWSASCSSGEEAISLFVMLKSFLPTDSFKVFASDINSLRIETFKRAAYRPYSFKIDGGEYESLVRNEGRDEDGLFHFSQENIARIDIFRHNIFQELTQRPAVLFDLIFFRNTLIYFDFPERELIIQRLVDKMERGAVLFTSTTESAFVSHPQLKLQNKENVYYFQKIEEGEE